MRLKIGDRLVFARHRAWVRAETDYTDVWICWILWSLSSSLETHLRWWWWPPPEAGVCLARGLGMSLCPHSPCSGQPSSASSHCCRDSWTWSSCSGPCRAQSDTCDSLPAGRSPDQTEPYLIFYLAPISQWDHWVKLRRKSLPLSSIFIHHPWLYQPHWLRAATVSELCISTFSCWMDH